MVSRVWGAEWGGVARVRVFSKKLFGSRRGAFGPGSGGKAEGLGWVDGDGANLQGGLKGGRAIGQVRRRGDVGRSFGKVFRRQAEGGGLVRLGVKG